MSTDTPEPEPISDAAFDAADDGYDGDYGADVAYWRQEYERRYADTPEYIEADYGVDWYIYRCAEYDEAEAAAEGDPADQPDDPPTAVDTRWIHETVALFREAGYTDLSAAPEVVTQFNRLRDAITTFRAAAELPPFSDEEFVAHIRQITTEYVEDGVTVTRNDAIEGNGLARLTASIDDALARLPLPDPVDNIPWWVHEAADLIEEHTGAVCEVTEEFAATMHEVRSRMDEVADELFDEPLDEPMSSRVFLARITAIMQTPETVVEPGDLEQDIMSHVRELLRTLPYPPGDSAVIDATGETGAAGEPGYVGEFGEPSYIMPMTDEMHFVAPETMQQVMSHFNVPADLVTVISTPRSPRRSALLSSSDYFMSLLRAGDVVWLPKEKWFARVRAAWVASELNTHIAAEITARSLGKIELVLPDLAAQTWFVRQNGTGVDEQPLIQPWYAQDLIQIAEVQRPHTAPGSQTKERVRVIDLAGSDAREVQEVD